MNAHLHRGWLSIWMSLRGGAPEPTAADLLALLSANAQLAGAAKFVLDAAGGLAVRAEIRADDRIDLAVLADRVKQTCLGIQQAQQWLGEGNVTAPAAVDAGAAQASADCTSRMAAICRDLGWPCLDRAAGQIAVELEVREGGYYATFEPAADGGTRLVVDLPAEAGELSATSRLAQCTLMLCAGRKARMARPAATVLGEHVAWRWEVRLGPHVQSVELNHALCALSVACRQTGQELAMLCDDLAATTFLMLRGRSSDKSS
jgi:hypothetical protein